MKKNKLHILALALLTLSFGACNIERTYYFMEGITINQIPDFSQDANEKGDEVYPDIFIELTTIDGDLIWSSSYLSNVDPGEYPIVYNLDNTLELYNMDYRLSIYDFDNIDQGPHDFLGEVIIEGHSIGSTYYSQYNDSELDGTFSVSVDMFVDRHE